MIRTIISIFITFAIICTLSGYEMYYVHTTFRDFSQILTALYDKTSEQSVTMQDIDGVRHFWENKKKRLNSWIPHNSLCEIDYHLYETQQYIYSQEYANALPQISVMLGIASEIPRAYTFRLENIF